jgi:hypothetical protein
MFDPNKWFALLCAAQRQNEDLIREQYKHLPNQRDIWELGEALDYAHNVAVENATIAGDEAYISTFQSHYDRVHEETYNGRAPAPVKVRYNRARTKPHNMFYGIISYRWCELMYDALCRNEEVVWRRLKPLANKDHYIDKLLAEAHLTAVAAANLGAEKAYITAFNANYDERHWETYKLWLGPARIRQITPLVKGRSDTTKH